MAKERRIDPLQVLVEIAVITIGIVLAYQLNTMRDIRKTEDSERKILKEIKSSLELDLIDLKSNINAHQRAISLIDSIKNWEGAYQEHIGLMMFDIFRDYLFLPQTSAFETLKSKGVDLIRNDSIRINTQRLYDFYYEVLLKYESEYTANQLHDDFEWLAVKYFKSFPVRETDLPVPKIENTSWLSDDELVVRLDLARFEHDFSLRLSQGVENEINKLIQSIDRELNQGQE